MKFFTLLNIITLSLIYTATASATSYRVSYKKSFSPSSFSKTELINIVAVKNSKPQVIRHLPYFIAEGPRLKSDTTNTNTYFTEEIKNNLNEEEITFFNNKLNKLNQAANFEQSEVRDLVTDGPASNRIHLTLLGDGYTLKDKEKFFDDAKRITNNLFATDTFSSFLPLFQVHAIFVPSNVSGIGDGSPINTAFGLYRTPKGSKRAIYPGNERTIEQALRLTPQTDYPIIIANDDFYGGLGGRYAISTRSIRSGMTVLNHELGHNFGEVGEEYDGGQVYSGANSSSDANAAQWSHWRNDSNNYAAKFLSGNYIWQNLKNKPYKTNFKAQAGETLGLELSTVGWSSPDDVYVYVNDIKINLGDSFHNDRNFYVLDNLATRVGVNTLDIKENLADGDNVLATAFLYAYPQGFSFDKTTLASFATYSDFGTKSYRPTHDGCLMRNMKLTHFCAVDQENMWYKFLARVSLIDSLTNDGTKVYLKTPKINGLTTRWFNAVTGLEFTNLQNQSEISFEKFSGVKNIKVSVELQTPEVRLYNNNFKVVKSIQL